MFEAENLDRQGNPAWAEIPLHYFAVKISNTALHGCRTNSTL